MKTPTSKPTEPSLLIIFADIWLIVPPDCGPEVLGGPDRPFPVANVWAQVSDQGLEKRVTCVQSCSSPDHPGGGVAHGRVFWLDEFHVVVDAAIDFIVFFSCPLLLKGDSSSVNLISRRVPPSFQHRFSVRPLGFSDSSQRWPEHRCPSLCPAGT